MSEATKTATTTTPHLDDAFAATPHRIQRLRRHLGLSESEMAAGLGLTVRAYLNLEARHRQRGMTPVLIGLAETTGVSIDWVLTGKAGPLRHMGTRNDLRPLGARGQPIPPKLRLVAPPDPVV